MCSPGCFSLLRGSVLLEDHVLAMYTTKSKTASDYVQYDQGTDKFVLFYQNLYFDKI